MSKCKLILIAYINSLLSHTITVICVIKLCNQVSNMMAFFLLNVKANNGF